MGRRKKIEQALLESPDANPEARAARVRRVRNMANLSRQQMCEHDDININSLKGWEIGRYGGLTGYGAEKIIRRVAQEGVQCTLDWLMYGIGVGPTAQTGFLNINTEPSPPPLLSIAMSEDEDKKIANELLLFKKQYKHAVDFIIEDDGMAPLYNSGEYVGGVNLFREKMDNAIGLDCIVELENGTILLRQLRKGSGLNTYTLVCINMQTKLEKPIIYDAILVSAAPVIFHRKKNTSF